MHTKVQVAELREALALLEPAISKKGTLESLRHVRLGEGKAVATDLDVAVTVDLPGSMRERRASSPTPRR